MRLVLHARLQNREPGLFNLPIPISSIPVLSPILTPLVGGNNQASSPKPTAPQPASSQPASKPAPQPTSPQPAPLPVTLPPIPVSLPPLPVSLPAPKAVPAPAPAPPPQQPPVPQTPPASNPPSGGAGDGGSAPSPGGGSATPGSGGRNPHSSKNSGSGSSNPPSSVNGGSGSPPSGSNGGNSVNPPAVNSVNPPTVNSVSPPHGSSAPSPSLKSAPSLPPSGVSPGSLNGSSGSTLKVSSATGVVVMPLNNAVASPASGSTPSNSVQGKLIQSSGASKASASPLTTAGTNGDPNSPGVLGRPNAPQGGNGSGSGSGSTGTNNASSSTSHPHLSSGAIGGIVAAVFICSLLAFFLLRKRYQRRKAERQVKWINGYVTGETADMQEAQRVTSMRSSWGTPIEHRFSDPFRWSTSNAANMQDGAYNNAESSYPYILSDSRAPVLPMPVHSPVEDRSHSPEDPFADENASPQPIKRLSSLPIRISLISTGSGTRDPFDDAQEYRPEDHISESNISSATFGHSSGLNRDPTFGTQANFPMPPPTPGSSSTGLAIGSPTDWLQPPGILISFPDSPVSPTFAASGTSSYPRRASVKLGFQPSQERRDEVHLEQGDQVNVVSVYEDGWAFVQNEKNNDRGLVPLNCLEIDNP